MGPQPPDYVHPGAGAPPEPAPPPEPGIVRPGAPSSSTPLADLAADFAEGDPRPTFEVFPHPASQYAPDHGRARYAVRYHVRIPDEHLAEWQKAAADPDYPGRFNDLRWSLLICASCCLGIERDGELVELGGAPLTFQHRDYWAILEASAENGGRPVRDELAAVRAFYGVDAWAKATAQGILEAAGYADQARPDPTRRSAHPGRQH